MYPNTFSSKKLYVYTYIRCISSSEANTIIFRLLQVKFVASITLHRVHFKITSETN